VEGEKTKSGERKEGISNCGLQIGHRGAKGISGCNLPPMLSSCVYRELSGGPRKTPPNCDACLLAFADSRSQQATRYS